MNNDLVYEFKKKLSVELVELLRVFKSKAKYTVLMRDSTENFRNSNKNKIDIINNILYRLGNTFYYPDTVITALLREESIIDYLYGFYEFKWANESLADYLRIGVISEVLKITPQEANKLSYELQEKEFEKNPAYRTSHFKKQ